MFAAFSCCSNTHCRCVVRPLTYSGYFISYQVFTFSTSTSCPQGTFLSFMRCSEEKVLTDGFYDRYQAYVRCTVQDVPLNVIRFNLSSPDLNLVKLMYLP